MKKIGKKSCNTTESSANIEKGSGNVESVEVIVEREEK